MPENALAKGFNAVARWPWWVKVFAGLVSAFLIISFIVAILPEEDPVKRIERSCAENYGPDRDAVFACKMALGQKYLAHIEELKAKKAADDAGVPIH